MRTNSKFKKPEVGVKPKIDAIKEDGAGKCVASLGKFELQLVLSDKIWGAKNYRYYASFHIFDAMVLQAAVCFATSKEGVSITVLTT